MQNTYRQRSALKLQIRELLTSAENALVNGERLQYEAFEFLKAARVLLDGLEHEQQLTDERKKALAIL